MGRKGGVRAAQTDHHLGPNVVAYGPLSTPLGSSEGTPTPNTQSGFTQSGCSAPREELREALPGYAQLTLRESFAGARLENLGLIPDSPLTAPQ